MSESAQARREPVEQPGAEAEEVREFIARNRLVGKTFVTSYISLSLDTLDALLARLEAAEGEGARLREALEPFVQYDFHAAAWIERLRGPDGELIRAVPADTIEALCAHVEAARSALAQSERLPSRDDEPCRCRVIEANQ